MAVELRQASAPTSEKTRSFAEGIRLVVWDLDGTFWSGTLTEGGHTYSRANHDIIVELAKRGIVSSICSKNDYETVKAILVQEGIWDYIVFPNISWTPKGPRLKQLVEDVQLRPETILLLDDNPLNLREAEHFVPGIQTADESFIREILASSFFKGKNDPELSRLKQYRLLEMRKADAVVAEDNVEFLRSCNIRVTIDHDVETHIDRAIELINRTNQLNFTKRRLPEEPELAREELRRQLSDFDMQAGLIRVTDRYGDYGYSGFYLTKTRRGRSRLQHFCFSCRILNMGVEQWVYERLGRPRIEVTGEVLTDIRSKSAIDWIAAGGGEAAVAGTNADMHTHPRVIIRGACLVSPLVHYFQLTSPEVIGEFNHFRNGVSIRIDHSLMLKYAIEGLPAAQMDVFKALGFYESDFDTAFAQFSNEPCIRLISNWVDTQNIIYRHKGTGLLVPYKIRRMRRAGLDMLSTVAEADQHAESLPERAREGLRFLRDNFEHVGALSEQDASDALDVIIEAVPCAQPLFFATAAEGGHERGSLGKGADFNQRIQRAAGRHPGKLVLPIAFAELATNAEEARSAHFHRNVYYRVYQEICMRYATLIGAGQPLSAVPVGVT